MAPQEQYNFGTISLLAQRLEKYAQKKVEKHLQTATYADSKLDSIEDIIASALSDGNMDKSEFDLVRAELLKFQKLCDKLRSKAVKPFDFKAEKSRIENAVYK